MQPIHQCCNKRTLYVALIWSQFSIWHPHLIKDIYALERIQRWATKYLLNDYDLDYKTHLSSSLTCFHWCTLTTLEISYSSLNLFKIHLISIISDCTQSCATTLLDHLTKLNILSYQLIIKGILLLDYHKH